MRVTNLDIAWMAGLLEGEGCFYLMKAQPITRRRPFAQDRSIMTCPLPKISLRMTDRDVVERACRLIGVGVVTVSGQTSSRKTVYHCGVTGAHAAGWMMTLYPWLGARRRDRIRRALAAWRTGKTHQYHVTRAWKRAEHLHAAGTLV